MSETYTDAQGVVQHKPYASGKPIGGALSPEDHQAFAADMLDRMHRVLTAIVATVPSLGGYAGALHQMRVGLDDYRNRMFPPDPALLASQQKAVDEAEINRLAAAKVNAARATMSAAPYPGAPAPMATQASVDEALKLHTDTTLAGAAAARDTAVAAAENDAKARDAAIADAKAATDRQVELDKFATERARETLMADIVPSVSATGLASRPVDPATGLPVRLSGPEQGLTPARVA